MTKKMNFFSWKWSSVFLLLIIAAGSYFHFRPEDDAAIAELDWWVACRIPGQSEAGGGKDCETLYYSLRYIQ
jgi:hypothetical protein